MRTENPILLLGQGHPRHPDSWSGIPNMLAAALESEGYDIAAADVESYGVADLVSKVRTFVPQRARWAARHHYGPLNFRARSRRAQRAVGTHPFGPVIQFGAQFCAFEKTDPRSFVYCDANVFYGMRSPFSKRSSALSARELSSMVERERAVYSRAKKIFVFSESLRQSFIADFGLGPDRVVTVYVGANLSQIPSGEELEVPKSADPTILFVGREFERKGGKDLLKAFRQVKEVIPNARLLIAGGNPSPPIPHGVAALGFIERTPEGRKRMSELYKEADLFCMPSLYEAFGIVFVEAMLHGLPCVGTTECAMPEIISKETGWTVTAESPHELAAVLIRALQDRQALRQMGRVARERALMKFTWESVARVMRQHMGDQSHAQGKLAAHDVQ